MEEPRREETGEALLNVPGRAFAASIRSELEALSRCGEDPAGGVTRLLYTEAWTAAQRRLEERMREAGLAVYYDEVGNLFGRLEGRSPEAGVILTGSHIDTVRCGGSYDGAAGIAAGLLALQHLRERYGPPVHTLEVVSLCEEEGSRFPLTYWGSGSITGRYSPRQVPPVRDADGMTLAEAMRQAGFGPGTHRPARRGDVAAFVELHIEQGAVLEQEKLQAGIVLGIVGQRRWTFTVEGETNHAGTTPMRYRRDALAGACELITLAEQMAREYGEALVVTAGSIEASPGLSNVIAGRVSFTLDMRHPDAETLEVFCAEVSDAFLEVCERRGLALRGEEWMQVPPAPMDPALSQNLAISCRRLGVRFRRLYSGAGHDAQVFQPHCPTAMLFVPSRGGISHAPGEFTSDEELAGGTAVLADLLYTLAYPVEAEEPDVEGSE
jgi:allantoate deiminase